jgi:recombination protein RecA
MDLALEHDVIQKSGSFFSYGELRLGQGRNNTKQFLAENPEPAAEIEAKVFEALGIERTGAAPAAVDADSKAGDAAEPEELEKAA